MEEILKKVDDIIIRLKEEDNIKEMGVLKHIINSNSDIQILLHDFNMSKESDISLSISKVKLYNNSVVKKYLSIQNELDSLILYFNSKLFKLVSNKSCHKF